MAKKYKYKIGDFVHVTDILDGHDFSFDAKIKDIWNIGYGKHYYFFEETATIYGDEDIKLATNDNNQLNSRLFQR
jgi:UDP-glucose 4-epimerase